MFEKILLSLLSKVGFETIKSLFSKRNPTLNEKMRRAILSAIEEFKNKYSNKYGDINNNFLANQSNFDKFLKSIDFDKPNLTIDDINPSGFDDSPSPPQEVIEDFINIINEEIKKYPELQILKSEKIILEELKEIKGLVKKEIPNPKFVNHDIYFRHHERHLSEIPAGHIERFKEYLKQIRLFLQSEECILLLFGKGGNGKSHIIREINSLVQEKFDLIFIQPNIREFKDAFQDELSTEKKYLFVFDDAERSLEEIPFIISLIKSKQRDYKLILTFRPSGKNSIDKIIYEYRMEDSTLKIPLPDWKTEELIKILDAMEVNIDTNEKEFISKMYPNPYLITWIGKQYKGEVTISIKKIKEKFIGDIKREAEQELKNIFQNPLEFLIDLAIIVPVNIEDGNFISKLSTRYQISDKEIENILNLLANLGLLRKIGTTIRFDPDMRGDLLLFYYLENETNEKNSRDLFDYWLSEYPEKVFINIQALSRYFVSSTIKDLCSSKIKEWIDNAEKTTGWDRINNLKLLSYIAHLTPEQSINLIHAYLSVPSVKTDNKQLYGFEPSTDDYGAVLISLMWLPQLRDQILNIIETLTHKKIGHYDNFKPYQLLKDLVSPLNHNPVHIFETLKKVEVEWIKNPAKLGLIESVLTETLASAHQVIKSYGYMIKIGEQPIKPSNDAIKMRRKSLDILIGLLNSDNEEMVLLGLKISRQIGDSRMRRFAISDIPLKDEIAEEHKVIIIRIGQKINNNPSLKLLQEIEDLFLHWYAAETAGTEEVINYLLNFPRSIEYLVFKSFIEPEYLILDFKEITNKAPNGNRWKWMFENYFHRHRNIDDALYSQFAKELEQKYKSSADTLFYLKNLDNQLTSLNPWNHPLIITEWVRINKEKYLYIRSKSDLWNNLPYRFKNEIEIELSKQSDEYVDNLAKEIFLNGFDIPRIQTFLKILQIKKTEREKLLDWIDKLIETENSEIHDLLTHDLYFIFVKYNLYEDLTNLCIKILTPFDQDKLNIFSRLDLTFDLLRKNRNKIPLEGIRGLAKISSEYLEISPRLDYSDESIIFLTFYDDIPKFINFLIHRFEKEKKDYSKFVSVPQGGFQTLKYLIDSTEKFELLVSGLEKITEKISWGGIRLSDLNNNCISLYNKETGKQYFVEYIEKLFEKNMIIRAVKFLPYIDKKGENLELIFKITDAAVESGNKDKVTNAYFSFEDSSFNWGTEELEKRKALFIKLKSFSKPGLHAKIIQDQIEYIGNRIEEFSRENKDFYTPRG